MFVFAGRCIFCPQLIICTSSLCVFQLGFSFCDKLFGLLIKNIEAMDPSILKGEQPTSKARPKVSEEQSAHDTALKLFILMNAICL